MNGCTSSRTSFVFGEMDRSNDRGIVLNQCAFVEPLDGQLGAQSLDFQDPIVEMNGVKLLQMIGGEINGNSYTTQSGSYAWTGIGAPTGKNNISMTKGATIRECATGIYMDGWSGGNYQPEYGLVHMDCARILDCHTCIAGEDPILDIDANVNSGGWRPNAFSIGNLEGTELYFDICYFRRVPPNNQVMAFFNDWGKNIGWAGVPFPNEYRLVKKVNSQCTYPSISLFALAALDYRPDCPVNPGGGEGQYAQFCDCENGTADYKALHRAGFEALQDAFEAVSDTELAPDWSDALAAFGQTAAQDRLTMANLAAPCQHYRQVARVFIDPATEGRTLQAGTGLQQIDLTLPKTLSGVRLWPNPATEALHILLPENGDYQVRVYNALGVQVYEKTGCSAFDLLPLEGWQSGFYHLRVDSATGGERPLTRTFTIQNH